MILKYIMHVPRESMSIECTSTQPQVAPIVYYFSYQVLRNSILHTRLRRKLLLSPTLRRACDEKVAEGAGMCTFPHAELISHTFDQRVEMWQFAKANS